MTQKNLKIIFISSYIPRECGIATYTNNVIGAIKAADPSVQASVVAMNDAEYNYPKEVISSINQEKDQDYIKAADVINKSDCEVVSVQHEFGIYGGFNGRKLLLLLKNIKKPIVITLHTVPVNLDKPVRIRSKKHASRIKLFEKMFSYVDGIAVMTETAKSYLESNVKSAKNKIAVIPHGAPILTSNKIKEFSAEKKSLGIDAGDIVISTFGLITPKKGIEYMISSMPKIVASNPEKRIKYFVLGKAHPKKPDHYLINLKKLAVKLKMEDNVIFDSRYLDYVEIYRYLVNSSIYITPYYSKEQASSGTLSYAIACGKCIVTTPYVFAQDAVGDHQVGELVKFRDSGSIVSVMNKLIQNPSLIAKYEKNSKEFGQTLEWPKIGQKFINLFTKNIRG